MAVFTKINFSDISRIEKLFNLGKIRKYEGIKQGIENTNYLIFIKDKKYILTIFEKRVDAKDLPFFMELMSRLSKLKIKCPQPIKNRKGNFIFNIKNKRACIVSFLKGKDKKNLNHNDCYSVGKNVAKLHLASKKIKLFRKNSLSINAWPNLLSKFDSRVNKISSNLNNIIKNDLKDIQKNWPKNLPKGIIHCDLFIDNIFFYKKKFYGFIDFYFSSNDFYIYELAICINSLCFKKRKSKFIFDRAKSAKLIEGYKSIRKLNIQEMKYFNVMCRGSALRYLLTRAFDYLNTPKSAVIRIKDPKEYIQKLNFHRKVKSFKDYI